MGLIDKGSGAPYVQQQPWPTADPDEVGPDADAFSGIVVNETWAQLEPGPGHFTFGPLRQSLAAVRAYNRAHPGHPLAVKLRFFGGFTAPGWAKTLGQTTPVAFATPSVTGTTGRWWTAAYRVAWSEFQHRLAARFDGDKLIRTVAVSSCATLSAEPFVFSPSPALHTELFADGWSSAAQQACLQGAFHDYAGWKQTPIEYTFNPFTSYAPTTNAGTPDPEFTDRLMTRCVHLRSARGRACVLSNHGLATDVATTSRSAPVYAEIDTLYDRHPAATQVGFQTFSPDTFGGCPAINVAIAYHGRSVELWPPGPAFKGFSDFPDPELVGWASALRTGTPLACSSS